VAHPIAARSAVAALAVVALTSCASTVQVRSATGGDLPVGGPDGAPGASPSSAGQLSGSPVTGLPGSGTTVAGPGRTLTPSGAPGAPRPVGRPGTGLVPAHGPGVTDTTVYFGVAYNSQRSATALALGAAGAASSYNIRDVVNVVVRYANSHGGFAGRKLEAVFYDSNGADAQTADGQACATWTQDHKVFALAGGSDARDACAEGAHAVAIGAGSATATTYQRFPHLVDPDTMRLDRLAAATAKGLHRAGYFTGKLGLVTWDHPDYRYAVKHGYLPALKAVGVQPVATAYLSPPQSPAALPDMAAAVANYVTKFRSQGIDHVIIQDGPAGFCADGCQTLVWMNQAKSQGWYPRYGQNSHNAPGSPIMPSDQMDHALAVDSSDVDPRNDAGWRPNTARQLCFKIQRDAGYPVEGNAVDQAFAALYCDQVFFLQRVVNSLSVLDADAFVEAVARLGSSFPTAFVYGSKFVPGRRDGASLVRTEEYFDSCKCLKYLTAPYDPD
jgi:hypothetical protein